MGSETMQKVLEASSHVNIYNSLGQADRHTPMHTTKEIRMPGIM